MKKQHIKHVRGVIRMAGISDENVDKLLKAADKYYENSKTDHDSRFLSWEYCYSAFQEMRVRKQENKVLTEDDYNHLSAELTAYLASWGMYSERKRGAVFQFRAHYRMHVPILKIIFDDKYDGLFDSSPKIELLSSHADLIRELDGEINNEYKTIRNKVLKKIVPSQVSQLLRSKVLLGAIGCTVAYDRFVKGSLKKLKLTSSFSVDSLVELMRIYEQHKEKFESREFKFLTANNSSSLYPPMKILDMALWQLGFNK